jgi:hypothetical protein
MPLRICSLIFLLMISSGAWAAEIVAAWPEGEPSEQVVDTEAYDDVTGATFHDIGFSGSVGFGTGFKSTAAVTLGLNRWVAMVLGGLYESHETGENLDKHWGPEVDLLLRFPNSTIVTPFVGAGAGWLRWIREKNDSPWDDSSSAIAGAFGGFRIALAEHFSFEIEQRSSEFLNSPPRSFSDPAKKEDRRWTRTNLGFVVSF